jgi:hypothetical protein
MHVADASSYRALTETEIEILRRQGCSVEEDQWSRVEVADGFQAARVAHVRFEGRVRLGALGGTTAGPEPRPALIERALIADCELGDQVRIRNIGVRLAGYEVGDGACVENIGSLVAQPGAAFGNGVEIAVLNEGGGREVPLFDGLSAQFAHLLCLHRYRPALVEQLRRIAQAEATRAKSVRGRIGQGAWIENVGRIRDVQVGPCARIHDAAWLVNGSILSCPAAPTHVGAGVQAADFIIAEGAVVDGAALIAKTYVGQACRVGRQFSAEGSLLFANSEAFHGEACSVLAGPYTVTHHKSTLLIAAWMSFYNAGSGTNQSNHMYKLGPVHEGRVERGSKTGSFSYMMWPCRVGAFSVVLGKHTRTFDTTDFPFSHIEALPDGRSSLIPGFNLTTVGTVRDGEKWPTRDRRTAIKRDRISWDVFSPYTVGSMLRGMRVLQELQEKTDRSVPAVAIGGATVKRVFLRTGLKQYRRAALMYLTDTIIARLETAAPEGTDALAGRIRSAPNAIHSERWVDIGGQLMPAARLEALVGAIESGELSDLAPLDHALDRIYDAYAEDEWVWVKHAYQHLSQIDLDHASTDQLAQVADTLLTTRTEFLEAVLADATKEFDPLSAVGFGTDGDASAVADDFRAIRGDYDSNRFIVRMRDEIESLRHRVERFKQALHA